MMPVLVLQQWLPILVFTCFCFGHNLLNVKEIEFKKSWAAAILSTSLRRLAVDRGHSMQAKFRIKQCQIILQWWQEVASLCLTLSFWESSDTTNRITLTVVTYKKTKYYLECELFDVAEATEKTSTGGTVVFKVVLYFVWLKEWHWETFHVFLSVVQGLTQVAAKYLA